MSSPSEFLTFYRRFATHPALRHRARAAAPSSLRTFTAAVPRLSSGGKLSTDASVASEKFPDDQHATNKKDKLDVQSDSSGKAREAKSRGEGGSATTESDSRGSTQQAKKDHPEAPDVVIGMQDERGGKGH
ncbi:hypothetical protein MBLNU459_g1012t1 [Dothideomycetes sp. NU459]